MEFAIVAVKSHVLAKPKREKDDVVGAYSLEFAVPAVLMAQTLEDAPPTTGAETS